MSNIKTYEVLHDPTYASITVEIDHDHISDFGKGPINMIETIKLMVEFFTDGDYRLSINEGSYLNTFLKQLCKECILLSLEYGYNVEGIVGFFNDREGYCKMDGSRGIKIIAIQEPDLDSQEDYFISEIKELCEES